MEKRASTTNNYKEKKAGKSKRGSGECQVWGTACLPQIIQNTQNSTSDSPLMGLDKSRPDHHHWTDGKAMGCQLNHALILGWLKNTV